MKNNSNINMFTPFIKYAQFDVRSPRKEYWLWILLQTLAMLLQLITGFLLGNNKVFFEVVGLLWLIWNLASVIPGLAVSIRRLHDTGHSGWNVLLSLIPFIGPMILLFFYLTESQSGSNKYGINPYGE